MLTPAHLLNAYAQGIFPMAESADDPRLYWFDPPRRGILPIGGVHAAGSLLRDLRRGGWSAHLDDDFGAVVAACADRDETWINAPLRDLYHELHDLGYAEALTIRQNGKVAGGIFGVTLGGAFFGESMVSQRRNGSRIALIWLSSHLARCGFTLFDTQFLTPHLASMGGVEISRADYRGRLVTALQTPANFHAEPLPDADQLWQEITQTS
ncbi:MAG: leucyl/phenylalanyl-tRNA--protein transferase [Paracoccus sp. (in: a-proteobacteria)]|uniref:leucyl/phenylalanyl-tRNA--protein transferase n=1 Tax=Paracoccus sp. TaxID=267 RepID=UPI0026DFC9D6|nr:leucyl/phenylalanyl-tRNA--protein transferase [Paracoccus sp. (in: a-proteobacteria)]MDO5632410.1 leucyl/phenylalanyl-tRNA--protein transferase [Paracoccus sp. (in: a-proteobacteria)]